MSLKWRISCKEIQGHVLNAVHVLEFMVFHLKIEKTVSFWTCPDKIDILKNSVQNDTVFIWTLFT